MRANPPTTREVQRHNGSRAEPANIQKRRARMILLRSRLLFKRPAWPAHLHHNTAAASAQHGVGGQPAFRHACCASGAIGRPRLISATRRIFCGSCMATKFCRARRRG